MVRPPSPRVLFATRWLAPIGVCLYVGVRVFYQVPDLPEGANVGSPPAGPGTVAVVLFLASVGVIGIAAEVQKRRRGEESDGGDS